MHSLAVIYRHACWGFSLTSWDHNSACSRAGICTYHRQNRSEVKFWGGNGDTRTQVELSPVRALFHALPQQLAQEVVEQGAASRLCGGSNGPDEGEDEEAFQQLCGLSREHLNHISIFVLYLTGLGVEPVATHQTSWLDSTSVCGMQQIQAGESSVQKRTNEVKRAWTAHVTC